MFLEDRTMTAYAQAIQSAVFDPVRPFGRMPSSAVLKRAAGITFVLAAITLIPGLLTEARAVAQDAYLEVAVFVAATLALVHGSEILFKTDIGRMLARNPRWQVPTGAALGAFPGCGGAIIAVTQFTRGRMSFGGLVATLIATAGDAMFLLIASEPMTAAIVLAVSVTIGVPFGYMLDAIHGSDFLRPARSLPSSGHGTRGWGALRHQDKLWFVLMVPAGVVAIPTTLMNVELSGISAAVMSTIAGVGVVLGLTMWMLDGEGDEEDEDYGTCRSATCHKPKPGIGQGIITSTNFVLAWVVAAMVGYEALVVVFQIDLEILLVSAAVVVPMAAILIGFIPGCGPQIVVTSLYVSGTLPLSAQMGNAIANDGDALFPAIAAAPRAAVVATLYSAIPAIIVGYSTYYLDG